MIDFTSALYLGLQHPSRSLRAWRELTTGVPAGLREPLEAREIALALARLQRFAAGALAPSTLHLTWDVFGLLSQHPITLYMDAGTYPIIRWGATRAALRGVRVRLFPHHDAHALERALARDGGGTRPVVATDGFCPRCGRPAPLAEYLASVRSRGGWLVADDTQALGILGESPTPNAPYGSGGGGTFQRQNIHGPEIIVIASLAKAFGVPLASVAGSGEMIDRYKRGGDTRIHCSPPSAASLSAARHALGMNGSSGDALRGELLQRVRQFRAGLADHGIASTGGLFPVQTLAPSDRSTVLTLHERLRRSGIAAVPVRGEDGRSRLCFLLSVRHTPNEIEHAVNAIAGACQAAHLISRPANHTVPRPFSRIHHLN